MISLDLKHNPTENNAQACVLQIAGEATIEHAAELKQALLELFAAAGELSIDCTQTSRIDLAGLQLLCAAQRTASEHRRKLNLEVHQLAVFQLALQACGLSGLANAGATAATPAEQSKGTPC